MDREQVKEELTKIVLYIFGVEESEVTEDADFRNDMYGDSLDEVEMIIMTEKEFDIQIKLEEADKVRTFGDAVDLVHGIVNSKNITQ